jgi:hypothetical protein
VDSGSPYTYITAQAKDVLYQAGESGPSERVPSKLFIQVVVVSFLYDFSTNFKQAPTLLCEFDVYLSHGLFLDINLFGVDFLKRLQLSIILSFHDDFYLAHTNAQCLQQILATSSLNADGGSPSSPSSSSSVNTREQRSSQENDEDIEQESGGGEQPTDMRGLRLTRTEYYCEPPVDVLNQGISFFIINYIK